MKLVPRKNQDMSLRKVLYHHAEADHSALSSSEILLDTLLLLAEIVFVLLVLEFSSGKKLLL